MFADLCKGLKVTQSFSPVTEHLEIMHHIEKQITQSQQGLVDNLAKTLWIHRTLPRNSLKEIPFSLTYGSEAVIPIIEATDDRGRVQKATKGKESKEVALIEKPYYRNKLQKYHSARSNKISLLEDMDSESAHMVAASKVPMLKPENGNTAPKTTVVEGVKKVIPPTTTEEKAQKRLEVKARSTLIMGIPNEHQLKFNFIKDAKLLLEAIEKRLQKLVSQLEILGETLSQEDVNQKLLRSLSPEWNTHAVVWRNKPELETMSMDDLYNNLKVYEPEVKGTSSSNTSTQNIAFVSFNNSGSTNEAVNTAHRVSAISTQVSAANSTNVDNLSDAVICAFFFSQPNNPQLENKDLQQLHLDELEEMDLRWEMDMLTMSPLVLINPRWSAKTTTRGDTLLGSVELQETKTTETRKAQEGVYQWRQLLPMPLLGIKKGSTALVSCDGIGGYDWSDQAEEGPTNYVLMAYSSLSSDSEVSNDSTCLKSCIETVEVLKSQYEQLLKRFEKSELMVLEQCYKGDSSEFCKKTHPCLKEHGFQVAVLMNSGLVSVNTARQVNVAHSKTTVNAARLKLRFSKTAHLIVMRPIHKKTTFKNNNFIQRINTVKDKNINTAKPKVVVNAARPKAVVNVVKGNNVNAVKALACWVWKPKNKVLDHGNPQVDLQDQGVIDSGCSRHMIGNMFYLTDYEEIDGGYVAFGGNPKGEKIIGKGTIKTGNLDFENVYFVRELKFNLFSVLQMCDKKNSVLFNDTECIVLSPNFKLIDESQVLLRVPRKNNMYSVDLKNIVPKGGLTYLFEKATSDESKLWNRRLGHLNFKTMNKLVKGNLVRGLPSKLFENDETCVACQKEKQHRASCKSKTEKSISLPLHLLHMDLFGPIFVKSLMKKMYCLVVIDDYSRFTWVFFLASKDKTSGILKSFITRIENLVDHKVKVIRCDNGTEFKNREMNKFCEKKGILRQYSVARTPQQNGVAERRNRTLIEAARTMLVDSMLPTTFWTEAVNTACYVQNRVLVVKPHNKTPYELFHGRTPTLSFMRPFGCPVTILNTIDHLGKFDGKADEGFFVGYSLNSKAFRVFNSKTRIVKENLHIRFSESTPNVVGSGPDWLFDIDALTRTMNYEPIVTGTQSNGFAGTKASDNAGQARKETEPVKDYILLVLWTADLPFSQNPKSSDEDGFKPSSDVEKKVNKDPRKESECNDQEKEDNVNSTNNVNCWELKASTSLYC
ncbi:putative ribonuclease H-like domain-containing protein [Tanacetum coccineum]